METAHFHIHIATGVPKKTEVYHFVSKNGDTLTVEQQAEAFNEAVQELNRVYEYGRFATKAGVLSLFDKFGFEWSKP